MINKSIDSTLKDSWEIENIQADKESEETFQNWMNIFHSFCNLINFSICIEKVTKIILCIWIILICWNFNWWWNQKKLCSLFQYVFFAYIKKYNQLMLLMMEYPILLIQHIPQKNNYQSFLLKKELWNDPINTTTKNAVRYLRSSIWKWKFFQRNAILIKRIFKFSYWRWKFYFF